MAQRGKRIEAWSYVELPLTSTEVAVRGHMAAIDRDTGKVVKGKVDPNILPIGYFDEDRTGDGTTNVRIQLFREKWLHRWKNSGGADAVDGGDVGNFCYVADSETVTITSTGASVAGRVWAANATYVWVEMASDLGPQGPEGPPGA